MEVIAENKNADIPTQIELTYKVFYPLLEQKSAEILKVQSKTFKYGSTDRHQLDVYYPPATPSGTAPVLFFVYGGGYASGDRRMPAPRSLVYANLGAFYAERGFVTVIADYRLLPNMKFPDPVVDIKDAISWFVAHDDDVNSGAAVKADSNNIFIMGHSAGAAILASLILLPGLLPNGIKPRVRGVILQAAVYHFDTKVPTLPPPLVSAYYGPPESVQKDCPLSLLRQASEDAVRSLPEVLLVVSEFDLPGVLESHDDFHKLLQERTGKEVEEAVMKGHSHITPHVSLYTGLGEEWAHGVIGWIKAKLPK
ncbi:hypothetical protein PHLGIDRAFT_108726 [Phlebiopsis gigantea 11061_1 CR5-6]|uniref:BD-FAE-like domain-containing protein n=1 Tax=Phlebiopsis gigantea (strain 11061_1 CR5-6) TaxID=745531 RepID=A0A0C3S840_PHLG1|nr:hypothetical protein PHLGIDRAFT_108726 [Phlebiopsis gigantea 11061_1 CR5-6]